MSNKQNILSKKERAQLKAALLWIWFIKNIKVFIWAIFIILVALTCMGVIKPDTPLLGTIFGSISEAFQGLIKDLDGDYTVWTVIESIISLGFIVGLAATNFDRIALRDIKSKKIKVLLIKAGLYFDKNGKLTKRAEAIANIDIDGDGKADEQKIVTDKDETLFEQVKHSGEELKTIINIDLSEIDEDGNSNVSNLEKVQETEEKESNKEVRVNIFIIIWRTIVNFFKRVFNNIKLVNELEKPDKEKVIASALESAEEVIQNDCDKITLNNVDQIAEVKEVTTEKAEADVKTTTNTEMKMEKKPAPVVSSNPQDALSALLHHK